MKKFVFLSIISGFLLITSCSKEREGDPRILVFSKTMAYKHASIPAGIEAIQKLGNEHGFDVDTTKNSALFEDEVLAKYSAVVFLSTTGDVLNHEQEAAFERYIQSGGGFVGIHAATDTEYDWNWYGRLVGAYFESHPPGTPEADFIIQVFEFPATSFFQDSVWHRSDEMYNFRKMNPDINVIMTVDETTYDGGTNGDYHPMSWYHEYDGGRSFYTALGHTEESFSEELYLKHLLGGIQYAIGKNEILDYSKASTELPPDQDRFSKVTLSVGKFYEPTEMAILPNNDVLISQRRGEIMRYDAATGELSEVAKLDVYHSALKAEGVNVEEGVMGLQKDPDYANNNWIYVYYSPSGDEPINRLSRFKYKDGDFDLDSEQIILVVESQREICCHTGGSIAFGPDNLLYLSTGDNSTPFNEEGATYVNNGYAPLNDLPGREQFDARRSSGNTNDLRGKIMRIKVNEDGSYNIPEGNLFPEGTEGTRAEIYTMGHRNPYRISVDPKNGYLYWGDIGPDAAGDSLATRGPRGYDELNQAKEAGNFGWPLFIGNNIPYRDYNYATGESGEAFDPAKPINNSANNTGLKELPSAMPAYVYYPYAPTLEFPQVGTGGRNAMAGPVYYSDLYAGEGNLPDYYDGKVLVYEWVRGWMKAVSFFEDGTFNKMEPIGSEIELNALIDMEMGPDGRLYLLEYGSGWFSQNPDSGLSYLEFNAGNRPPVIDDFIVDKASGPAPLNVTLEVKARDREKDEVKYIWDLGNGEKIESAAPVLNYTFEDTGEFDISVEVIDDKGAAVSSNAISVVSGNTIPEVDIVLKGGNSSFFMAGVPIEYSVIVTDPDADEEINTEDIFVSVDYLEGYDETQMAVGHQQFSAVATGKALSMSMDCKTCHKETEASIGPSYLEISEKYKGQEGSRTYLQEKIISGGSGAWGEVMMPAHPNITSMEARQLTLYIESLAADESLNKSLPASGTIIPSQADAGKTMVLTASYTDNGTIPLTGYGSARLKSSSFSFSEKTKTEGMNPISFGGRNLLLLPPSRSWFLLENVDLTGVGSAVLIAGWRSPPEFGIEFELRKGSPDGELLGNGKLGPIQAGQEGGMIFIPLSAEQNGTSDALYFVYQPSIPEGTTPAPFALMGGSFNAQ